MAEDTLIQQGEFTSDGTDKIIPLRAGVDWVEVINLTNIAASTQWDGIRWYWQKEMTDDDATVEFHATASQIVSLSTAAIGFNGATYRGISLIDTSSPYTFTQAITAGTSLTQPVYSTADTDRLVNGSIVRIYNTAHTNLNGVDFTVDGVVNDVEFALTNPIQQAPGLIAGANGFWKYIAPNATVYDIFHPKKRVVGDITQDNPGVVTTLVDHNFVTGQEIRMVVPASGGMTELNDQMVVVTRLTASTFSIGVDTNAYTAFVYPLPAAMPTTHAQAIPVGQSAAYNTSFDGTLEDTGFIGMILGTSTTAGIAAGSPGGSNGDVIKWRAGKSFRTDIG